MLTAPVMIYHVPYRLDPQATSASGIRPVKMRKAFENIGYHVMEISGTSGERKQRMREIKAQIRNGLSVDFVYSEADTNPTTFSDPHRSVHPFFDSNFLAWCRRRDIPVGLFYRDVYWQAPEHIAAVGFTRATILGFFHIIELIGYRRAVTTLFLPSMRMAKSIQAVIPSRMCSALPPASDSIDTLEQKTSPQLLYVGGLGSFYRMHKLISAVESSAQSSLTICTPETQWREEQIDYLPLITRGATTVVHQSGPGLSDLYDQATIGSLFVEPIPYREFAAPLKMYEYLGRAKPIIATSGTLSGEFVKNNGIGWTIPYTVEALSELLKMLELNPSEIEEKTKRARLVREAHTWETRARQVRDQLLTRKA